MMTIEMEPCLEKTMLSTTEVLIYFENCIKKLEDFDQHKNSESFVLELEKLLASNQIVINSENAEYHHEYLIEIYFYRKLLAWLKLYSWQKRKKLHIYLPESRKDNFAFSDESFNFSKEFAKKVIDKLIKREKTLNYLFVLGFEEGALEYGNNVERSTRMEIKQFLRANHRNYTDDFDLF